MTSSRVPGSRPHEGHARPDHSPTTDRATGAGFTEAAAAVGGVVLRCRRRVVRLTPSTSAISVSGLSALTIRAACLVLASVITVGRAPRWSHQIRQPPPQQGRPAHGVSR